jgi:hypothetical protein
MMTLQEQSKDLKEKLPSSEHVARAVLCVVESLAEVIDEVKRLHHRIAVLEEKSRNK